MVDNKIIILFTIFPLNIGNFTGKLHHELICTFLTRSIIFLEYAFRFFGSWPYEENAQESLKKRFGKDLVQRGKMSAKSVQIS